MGEFTDGQAPNDIAAQETQGDVKETEDGYDSGVEGIKADGVYKNTPVFDVSKNEFFKNMRLDRNRMRFSSEKPKQFMQSTKYRNAFYARYTDSNGKQYLTKIK